MKSFYSALYLRAPSIDDLVVSRVVNHAELNNSDLKSHVFFVFATK